MAETIEVVNRRDGMIQIQVSQSATGNDGAIIADPGDGYRIQIISLVATLDTDGTLELLSADNPILELDMSARAPFAFRGTRQDPFLECNPSESLNLITAGGAAELTIRYKIAFGA